MRALTTASSVRGNGRSAGGVADTYDTNSRLWREPDTSAPSSLAQTEGAADEAFAADTSADAAAAAATSAADARRGDSPSSAAHQAIDSTEADVAAEDVAETHASDAALAAEDERAARQAEQRDVQSGTTGPTTPGIHPAQALRQPPVPDDSADGSVEIRFKHPE